MASFSMGRVFSCAAVLVSSVAFGCSDEPEAASNGVNDVRLACEIRAKWNRASDDCSLCEAAAISPRCECESLAAFSAVCIEQADARRAACATSVDACVLACEHTDCGCVEACYIEGDACKRASAARDGCVAEKCSQYCK